MHGDRDILPLGLLLLGLRVLDDFLSFCCMTELGDGFGCVIFAHLLISWRKLQLSPLEHCPLNSHCQLGLLPLGLLVLDDFRSFCRMKEFGDGFDGELFPRLFTSWRKLQLSPFEHCPLAFHCQKYPRLLCSRCFLSPDS